jgi:hypothetical protein
LKGLKSLNFSGAERSGFFGDGPLHLVATQRVTGPVGGG